MREFTSLKAKSPAQSILRPARVEPAHSPAYVGRLPGATFGDQTPTLQRTIGNQSLLRLLSSADADPAASTRSDGPGHAARYGASSEGRSLDAAVRAPFERAFGVSFEQVRVHDDARAADAAQAVAARAYTIGNHLFFGAGAYAPHSAAGRATLAHELHAHRAAPGPGSGGSCLPQCVE